ncbi:MAG: FAD/NAD(P)-binding protein [Verrucomicrobiae bacterium]|nr:FAD/NAD(P)-binding protein [Verrucomicrobiae bacterium]
MTSSRIVIIGGGFSGILTAVNLVRLATSSAPGSGPMVTVVNARRPSGRGIAYGTRRIEHLLNVAARNMSAFPDLPDHFAGWLRTRSEYENLPENELREKFIPRIVYGDYLRSLIHHHLDRVEFVEGEAMAMEADGTVILSDGRRLEADRVVLACGNETPAPLPGAETLADHPAWVGNPWSDWETRLPDYGGTIVLLGTGLTTVDAIVSLRALGWQGCVHAVSRHGWLPHAHFRGIDYPDFPPKDVDLAELGLKRLLALMEQHCARLHELGANPAIIVDKMRPHTQRIWANFTKEEKLAFARDHAARWNVLRHRIAPEIHAQVATAELTGLLRVHTATISGVSPEGNQVNVELENGTCLRGDLVINATGPQTRFTALRNPLLQDLLARGLIAPDELDMGLRIDPDHVLVDAAGERSKVLLAMGPLLRGTYWETIAVPELRGQARRVAETLLGLGSEAVKEEVMMEYMI